MDFKDLLSKKDAHLEIVDNLEIELKINGFVKKINLGKVVEGKKAQLSRIEKIILEKWDDIKNSFNSVQKYDDILEAIKNLFSDNDEKKWLFLHHSNEKFKEITLDGIQKVKIIVLEKGEIELTLGTVTEGVNTKNLRVENTIKAQWDSIKNTFNSDQKYSDILDTIKGLLTNDENKNLIVLDASNVDTKEITLDTNQKVKIKVGSRKVIELTLDTVINNVEKIFNLIQEKVNTINLWDLIESNYEQILTKAIEELEDSDKARVKLNDHKKEDFLALYQEKIQIKINNTNKEILIKKVKFK